MPDAYIPVMLFVLVACGAVSGFHSFLDPNAVFVLSGVKPMTIHTTAIVTSAGGN